MSRNRPAGLPAYGEAAVHWKPGLRDRVTLTPIDSWQNGVGGARGVTGSRDLYPLLAHGPEQVVRLTVAEATDFRFDPEMKSQIASGSVNELQEYFEARIHGPLNWSEIDRIVLHRSTWTQEQKTHLELFARKFRPEIRPRHSGGDPLRTGVDEGRADRVASAAARRSRKSLPPPARVKKRARGPTG
ncbi:hypothetical protein [Streptomyces varsoviensis]|uniref:Uncharacterized protein n=1 Tax=Streptomyces varsoviensis TaxID=67373 RepID=A0ABR5JAX0_9ACTN|nr:hypothetical protein [Streptomyces varsoviensis]KOG90554.1 hypothetical protein ADK38_08080 [Streptomyces varsoviensis]